MKEELKKEFEEKFVKPRYVDDLNVGDLFAWINEHFQEKGQWIDVKDGPPKENIKVLWKNKYDMGEDSIFTGYWNEDENCASTEKNYEGYHYAITHWMPLPKA